MQQLLINGMPIAQKDGVQVPNPILKFSRGSVTGTYIVQGQNDQLASLRGHMMHVLQTMLPNHDTTMVPEGTMA